MVELTFQSRGNDLTQLHRQEESWDLSGWEEPNHYLPCGWASIRSSVPFATIMPSLISFMYEFWSQPYGLYVEQVPAAQSPLAPTASNINIYGAVYTCPYTLRSGSMDKCPWGFRDFSTNLCAGEGQGFA